MKGDRHLGLYQHLLHHQQSNVDGLIRRFFLCHRFRLARAVVNPLFEDGSWR